MTIQHLGPLQDTSYFQKASYLYMAKIFSSETREEKESNKPSNQPNSRRSETTSNRRRQAVLQKTSFQPSEHARSQQSIAVHY